jgi:hypothetical protein
MSTKPETLNLSIGGLAIRLSIPDTDIFNQAKNRYRAFSSTTEGSSLIEFEVISGAHRFDTSLSWDNQKVVFNNPSIRGYIDLEANKGAFSLAMERPFEAIDYCTRVAYALLAFQAGGLMIHAAGISKNGRTYLFAGQSGAGKSTVSGLSRNATVLNDDLVVVLREGDDWRVHGTPFWNPSQVRPANDSALLEKIFFLVQDRLVFVEPISFGSALASLVSSVPVLTTNPQLGDELLVRCASMLTNVPHSKLHFLPDESFWKVIETPDE